MDFMFGSGIGTAACGLVLVVGGLVAYGILEIIVSGSSKRKNTLDED